jgi:hypothetical protein
MKIKFTVTHIAGQREFNLELERPPTVREKHRWAVEGEERYKMALEAILAAPNEAKDIAAMALQ